MFMFISGQMATPANVLNKDEERSLFLHAMVSAPFFVKQNFSTLSVMLTV